MVYDYQYTLAAALTSIFLITLFLVRKNYRTPSSMIYYSLLICNFIAAVSDLISIFAIEDPVKFGIPFSYLISIIYFVSYNIESILLILYVSQVCEIKKFRKVIQIVSEVLIAIVCLVVIPTPLTHSAFYFDNNLAYCHGPLFIVLYITSISSLLFCIILALIYHQRFHFYQVSSIVIFILFMVGAILVQLIFPSVLIGELLADLILIYIYVIFENPVYYCYRDTQCYNLKAFEDTVSHAVLGKTPFTITAFKFEDYKYSLIRFGEGFGEHFTREKASRIADLFPEKAYCLSNDIFAVIDHSNPQKIEKEIENYIGVTNRIFICQLDQSILSNAETSALNIIRYMLKRHEKSITEETIKYEIVEKKNRSEHISYLLSKALEKDTFEVFYQPIYDVTLKHYRSSEALLRLKDETGNYISPEEFIPIAENNGMIIPIGNFVLEKVCQFIASTEFAKLGIDYIEVNLSPVQSMQDDMPENVLRIIQKYKIDPQKINFEITETAEISSDSKLYQNMETLSKNGIKFSIDDFGSGFASAKYLYELPVSLVKIDKEILWNAMKNENALSILKYTIKMVHEVGKEIVVEGVENIEMESILKNLECDFMQGFYFSKPIPEKEYVIFLKNKDFIGIE